MRRLILAFAMIATLLTVRPIVAQIPQAAQVPQAQAPQKESLLIGPGDLIQVDVLDTPEMEQQVRVTDDGSAPLAFVGNVQVAGKTPSAAADAIRLLLISKNVMKHPQVS